MCQYNLLVMQRNVAFNQVKHSTSDVYRMTDAFACGHAILSIIWPDRSKATADMLTPLLLHLASQTEPALEIGIPDGHHS